MSDDRSYEEVSEDIAVRINELRLENVRLHAEIASLRTDRKILATFLAIFVGLALLIPLPADAEEPEPTYVVTERVIIGNPNQRGQLYANDVPMCSGYVFRCPMMHPLGSYEFLIRDGATESPPFAIQRVPNCDSNGDGCWTTSDFFSFATTSGECGVDEVPLFRANWGKCIGPDGALRERE